MKYVINQDGLKEPFDMVRLKNCAYRRLRAEAGLSSDRAEIDSEVLAKRVVELLESKHGQDYIPKIEEIKRTLTKLIKKEYIEKNPKKK